MKTSLWLPVLLLTGACASQPPSDEVLADREYHREAARIEAAEEFERHKARCQRRGGAMVVNRTFSPRIRSSQADERLATCDPGWLGSML